MPMARTALLNTDTEDLKELLSNGKSYSVPPYQRDYSWKQEHWEDLWEDLIIKHRRSCWIIQTGRKRPLPYVKPEWRKLPRPFGH
jgi:uncharacterized protein with ParB-like and HNH nuclease domain